MKVESQVPPCGQIDVPDDTRLRELARLLVVGIGMLDLEGQPYETVATLYHVRDEVVAELDKEPAGA